MKSEESTKALAPPTKPLLVWDGNCGFCRFWIEYWETVTGPAVSYAPFQEVAGQFPDIPIEKFKSAVQLIEPDGRVSSAAEAVFRALSYVPGRRWMLWAYQHLPGFAPVAESCYCFVAGHRDSLSLFNRMFWGKRLETARYVLTRRLFLRLLGLVYLIAFASFWPQIPGLIGADGILPARALLETVYEQLGPRGYYLLPTLAWLDPADGFLRFLAGGGALVSLLVVAGIATGPALLVLWAFYLSLVTAGQDFMSFQWDTLLLEAGFLAIFFAPWSLREWKSESRPSTTLVWLFRWLVFRLMFLSGAVKLLSHDPAWRSLTALTFHYETQPIPNVVAWYMDKLPLWSQKLSAVFMFGTELVVPFLIFLPRRLRFFGAAAMTFFELLIFLTGNYTFFNLLSIGLCVLLLDDAFLERFPRLRIADFRLRIPESEKDNLQSTIRNPRSRDAGPTRRLAVAALAVVVVSISLVEMAGTFRIALPEPGIARALAPFYVVNSYGLFAVMTTSRPEIIMEGSDDGEVWRPYEFKYKPGDLKRPPPWVEPHQPRLDWQMWFAALGSYREQRWFVGLALRLLQGSPAVLRLLETNPFPDHPPRYVRAMLYDYHFTSRAERAATGDWWKRQLLGFYLQPVSLRGEGRSP